MKPSPEESFATVVLAGGRSTRMGTDKAALRLPDGRDLLRRQLEILEELQPAERFVSARSGQLLPPLPIGVTRVEDDGSAGPLGGIIASLRATTVARLLVLAVDLPRMTAEHLRPLLATGSPPGVVYRRDGYWEPLVAVYPRSALPWLEAASADGHWSLQRLLDSPAAQAHFRRLPADADAPFANWNRPEDWSP